jgi:hypothetical protein
MSRDNTSVEGDGVVNGPLQLTKCKCGCSVFTTHLQDDSPVPFSKCTQCGELYEPDEIQLEDEKGEKDESGQ